MPKVLLVEDDEFISDFISQKLIQAGYEVSVCVDGSQAIDKAQTESPAVILLDLTLPRRPGAEILSDLQANPKLKLIPVIIFSNNDDPTLKEQLLQAGADDFYMKAATDPAELVEKIKAILS